MDYLHNFLKFVIARCNVNMRDALELIKKSEQDYQNEDERILKYPEHMLMCKYIPVIVYGNLLKINEEYKPMIRLLVKDVYADRCTTLLNEIYKFTYGED